MNGLEPLLGHLLTVLGRLGVVCGRSWAEKVALARKRKQWESDRDKEPRRKIAQTRTGTAPDSRPAPFALFAPFGPFAPFCRIAPRAYRTSPVRVCGDC